MLFEGKAKSLIDELRRAPWATDEERKAFVERFVAAGEVPVKPLVALLRDLSQETNTRVAETALTTIQEVLSSLGRGEHIGPLVEVLRGAPPLTRRHLVQTLAAMPVREQPAPVIELLRAEKEDLRQAGLSIVTGKGGRTVYELLGKALFEGTWVSRKETIEAIVKIGGHHAIPVLGQVLREGEKQDQLVALKYLTDMTIMRPRQRAAVDALRAACTLDDPELTMRIAGAMGEIAGPEDAPFLVDLLKKADRRFQQPLIRSLGQLKAPEAIPALIPFLRSGYVGVRIEALTALGSFENEVVLEHLIELLREEELMVRQKAIEVLGNLGRSPNVRIGRMLVLMMRDRDVNVRRSVVEVIRAIGGDHEKQAWSRLVDYLRDEDWWVRESVTDVLTEIGGREILEPILVLLADKNEIVRRYALEVVVRIGDKSVAPEILKCTRDPDWWVRERAIESLAALGVKEAVPALLQLLRAEEDLRWVIVKALGQLVDPRGLPALLVLLTTGSAEFRLEVLSAVERFSDPQIAPRVQPLLADPDKRVRHRALQILQRLQVKLTEEEKSRVAYRDLSFIDRLLLETRERGAHDLFLLAGRPPLVKHHGEVNPMRGDDLSNEQIERILVDIMNPAQHKIFFEDLKDVDFSYSIRGEGGRFRVNVYRQFTGLAAAFRVVPSETRTLEQLGLPAIAKRFCQMRNGLVLVTGPTASGKSTTLAAMIDYINRNRTEHIITVEDPIEYVHANLRCTINQREVGEHTKGFAEALRGALRQDPDVILVGEMRDYETISTAITAAETGHLVFGTLHTVSAAKTVDRIIDVFPPAYQAQVRTMIAETLRGVMSQHLVPRADGKGVALAIEVMVCTDAISNAIRKEKTFQIPSMLATSAEQGNQLMDNELLRLVKQGAITPEDGYNKAENKREFEAYLPASAEVESARAAERVLGASSGAAAAPARPAAGARPQAERPAAAPAPARPPAAGAPPSPTRPPLEKPAAAAAPQRPTPTAGPARPQGTHGKDR